jgi:hypothetical protein
LCILERFPKLQDVTESSALFMPAVVVGAVYLLYLTVAAREAQSRGRRRALLAAAGTALGSPEEDAAAGLVCGATHELPASFCLRGATPLVEVAAPAAELVVAVHPRLAPSSGPPEPGLVLLGDTAFDSAFVVEGAPADLVRCLLDADLRARLLVLRPSALTVENAAVELRGRAAMTASDVPALVELAGRVAVGAPAARDRADRLLTQVTGAPYRPAVDASAVRAAQAARVAELSGFVELARARARAARRALVLTAALGTVLVLSLYAAGS